METQSRTYNNGTIIEYTYTIVPSSGYSYKNTIYIDVDSGSLIDPNSITLTLDLNSEDSFQGTCCSIDDICGNGWETEDGLCWVTTSGVSWSV